MEFYYACQLKRRLAPAWGVWGIRGKYFNMKRLKLKKDPKKPGGYEDNKLS